MTATASRATQPVLRALLDQARRKDYRSGVLGVRARPEWPGDPVFTHHEVPVRVVPCVSALAVREALLGRDRDQWLVVLTDRPDDDLGAGVLSHLLWHRLRTPDPWAAVRERFAATGIDPALTAAADDREVATGLLAAAPSAGWPPAPGGVLTLDHALGAVAAAHLGLTDPVVDAASVLAWTAGPAVLTRVADLRELAGDALTGAVLTWAADRAGTMGGPLLRLLRAGQARDAVPLGLTAGLLAGQAGTGTEAATAAGMQLAREGLIRLEPRLGGPVPAGLLRSWAGEAAAVVAGLLRDPDSHPNGTALLARADELLAESRADGLADHSDLLPSGLTRRFAGLAQALRAALPGAAAWGAAPTAPAPAAGPAPGPLRPAGPAPGPLRPAPARLPAAGPAPGRPPVTGPGLDSPGLDSPALDGIERAWLQVATHRLAAGDPRTPAFRAAVRLARWLATSLAAAGTSLAALARRQASDDGWADSAVNDAAAGVSDPELGAGLAAVLAAARARRAAHDTAFAAALAASTADDRPLAGDDGRPAGVCYLEDLLAQVVLPLAKTALPADPTAALDLAGPAGQATVPVLLLVLDGMSTGVGTEVVASVLSRAGEGWAEALLPGQPRRAAALAVLPTLTEVSRASLLCGQLRTGGQEDEKRGYARLLREHGVSGDEPYHKKILDTSRLGFAVADEVAAAIADVGRQQLVTCVLNTIDDALDRSDPGGTDWGADAVRHLVPLLDRARQAGRVVILTADHGHVVERRHGRVRPSQDISSSRSRSAAEPAGDGEVLVAGRRVLRHDGRAVLAVDEQLRYGPLKAGYHGGAAPAEAVVPVAVLVSGPAEQFGLAPAPPQEPAWWLDPAAEPAAFAAADGPDRAVGAAGWTGRDRETVAARPAPAAPAWGRDPAAAGPAPSGPSRGRAADQAPTLFDGPVPAPPAGGQPAGPAAPPTPAAPRTSPAPAAPAVSTLAGTVADAVLRSPAWAGQRKIAGRVSVSDDRVAALLGALLAAPGGRLDPARAAAALQVAPGALRGAILHAQRLLNVEGYPVLRVDADGATVILDEGLLREQFGTGRD